MLKRIQGKQFSAEGMSISPATTEISIEVPQKLKNRTPI
jgi:hypothetical protein